MYIPEDFKETDSRKILEFILHNEFGILVANINGGMQAVHIPFLISETEKGILLKGHFPPIF
jgi:predicted FMN-binding regulatory protein PaiB